MAIYELDSVVKAYEKRRTSISALAETTLSIAEGDFVALVGPSGSGKTTLLSILGGMLAPTSGRVVLDGKSLYDMSITDRTRLRRNRIGFVFQSFNLIPWLSAQENVQVPLSLAGRRPVEQRARAEGLLDRVGLSDRLTHRPAELSQGQQQRVALARTLANDPGIILADEPTGNLDPESRETVMRHLADFHSDGRTIVMVNHDEYAAGFARRRLKLIDGALHEDPSSAHAA